MKVKVDAERCEAHGMCEASVSEFFTVDDDGFSSIGADKAVPPGLEDRVRVGVESCPVAALLVIAD